MSTIDQQIAKYRGQHIRAKAIRKRRLIRLSSQDALADKARLIAAGKGAHGRSMSPSLFDRHTALLPTPY